MPIRTIPGTDVQYHLICFDEQGVERPETDGTMLSDTVRLRLADAGITDVFFCSHGWQGDVPAAISQYDKWVGVMASAHDHEAARKIRPDFKAIVIGVHWPSLPFGNEDMPANGGVLGSDDDTDIEVAIDHFAASIANTKTARNAIRVILEAAQEDDGERETLPSHVRVAYDQLAYEAALPDGSTNPGGAPGEEQGAWDADAIYTQARSAASADAQVNTEASEVPGLLGDVWLDNLKGLVVVPLQQMSFWKMKDRARTIGEGGVHELLVSLQEATASKTQFHLMGHSFGCIVMSAAVAGASTGSPLVRPVDTLFLVQGALSLWSYALDIPVAQGKAGYFNRILSESLVRGPIVTTQSRFDSAVSNLYPLAAWMRSQLVLGDEYPKYGAVGTYGIQGISEIVSNTTLEAATYDYGFRRQHVYNLDSSNIIKNKDGWGGAHSDIAHPEVAHAFWQAVLCAVA